MKTANFRIKRKKEGWKEGGWAEGGREITRIKDKEKERKKERERMKADTEALE